MILLRDVFYALYQHLKTDHSNLLLSGFVQLGWIRSSSAQVSDYPGSLGVAELSGALEQLQSGGGWL